MPDRHEQPNYMIPIEGRWAKFSNKWLKELDEKDHETYIWLDYYISEYQRNPIGFFLPHGVPHPVHGNDGRAVANDYEHDLILVTANNQSGKSFLGAAYTILRSIPCDPSWICFKEHGITLPEWSGPKEVIVASYSWDLMNSIWNTYRMLLPRHELLTYSPNWGWFPDEKGRARNIRFHNIGKEVVLACGTRLIFKCYRQSVSQWESIQCDIAHMDEQCDEDRFDAVSQRQITRGDYTPIIMTLTGHVIPDRPDTGAAGWIKQKIVDRGETKGRKVGQYKLSVDSTPDAIMSKKTKRNLYIQWVEEPERNRDFKKIEEGKARYWGEWQHGAGLTFDMFSEDIHVIKPFNVKKYLPTYYRMIDHGTKPLAAGLFAVMPWGDVVMFDEVYEDVPSIRVGCEKIRKMCGSTTRQVAHDYWEEVFGEYEIAASECDSRSFGTKSPDSGKTIGQIYNENGVLCYPASGETRGKGDDQGGLIGMAKELFALQKGRKHIDVTIGRRNDNELDKLGVPVLYITDNCYNTISEIRKYAGEDKDDHLISCLVGDTIVSCESGDKPIKEVKVGDRVLTRDGYKRVLGSEMTNASADILELTCSDGTTIRGTGDHPFFNSEKREWISLDKLTKDMVLYSLSSLRKDRLWLKQKQSRTMELGSIGIQNQSAGAIGYIIDPIAGISAMASRLCTSRFGRMLTAMSQKVTSYITRTATRSITTLPILSASARRSTRLGIQENIRKNTLNCGTKGGTLGWLLKKGESILEKMANGWRSITIQPLGSEMQFAPSAARSTSTADLAEANIVASNASAGFTRNKKDTLSKRFVLSAEASLKQPNTQEPKPVRVLAVRACETKQSVYNLSVEDQPEFFANGILVHNCLKFFAGRDRPYLGDGYMDNRDKAYQHYEQADPPARSAITGY